MVNSFSRFAEDEVGLSSPQSRQRKHLSAPSLGATAFMHQKASVRSRRSRSRSPTNDGGTLPFVFELDTVQKRMFILRTVGGLDAHDWVQAIKDAHAAVKQAMQRDAGHSCWQQVMHLRQTSQACG